MRFFIKNYLLLVIFLAGCGVKTEGPTTTKTTVAATPPVQMRPHEFTEYVEFIKRQAVQQGIKPEVVDNAFAKVHQVHHVVYADKNQPEKRVSLDDYLKRTLPAWKIAQGRQLMQQHHEVLTAASQKYGVPIEYLVALWGMESSFGKIQGREDVISALTTLAYEGRRESFFVQQLMAALKILQHADVDVAQLKGSWAGAMGQIQFMPTTLLSYGVDGNGDGRVDIWGNLNDVFFSAANYLAQEGWQPGGPWGQEVTLPPHFEKQWLGIQKEQQRNLQQWRALGVTTKGNPPLVSEDKAAWIIMPDDKTGRAFMVYDNFQVLMRWNRSYYFAISVAMMAQQLAQ